MPKSYTRKYKGRGGPYRKYRKQYTKGSKSRAATSIQALVRSRQARATLARQSKRASIKRFNRKSSEVIYKSFTVVCPDEVLINPYTANPNQGLLCSDPATAEYKANFQFGMFYKNPSALGLCTMLSPEMQNMLELYKQCRVVHGSISMMRYSDGVGDGLTPAGAGAGPLVNSSIGITGDKDWIGYLHSTIDTGAYKNVQDLQNLSIPPNTLIASFNPNEYLSNSNSRLHQVSWDNRKSIKTKVLLPTSKSEWAQQRVTLYDLPGTTPIVQLRTNGPWVDTNIVEGVAKGTYPVGHTNYQSVYSLTTLPAVTFYGTGFPSRVRSVAGTSTPVLTPIHKVLLSCTVAFRVPTLRN